MLLEVTSDGIYCPAGDFHIDPWNPVARAVITHAHSDHARPGSGAYLANDRGEEILRARIGDDATVQTVAYGEATPIGGVSVSLHPAGHVLGSSQVRVEQAGEVWVVTGDYKLADDPTTDAFELVRCNTLITETTFGLPIYRWPSSEEVFNDVNAWWRDNQRAGRTSILFAYALGKAQRAIASVDSTIGPIYTHGAVERVNDRYRAAGIALPCTQYATNKSGVRWSEGLIVAPQSAAGSSWLRRFGDVSLAFASGWMTVRGRRRQRGVDRGFVVSDHVDWPSLLQVVEESGADRVLATHGYAGVVARYLREKGIEADALETRFVGERDDIAEDPTDAPDGDDSNGGTEP